MKYAFSVWSFRKYQTSICRAGQIQLGHGDVANLPSISPITALQPGDQNTNAKIPMKILVFGAGVIGTLYAARLQEAGHRVTILARSSRLADIRRHGLVLEDVVSGARSFLVRAHYRHSSSGGLSSLNLVAYLKN
jgi:hypothetical protein